MKNMFKYTFATLLSFLALTACTDQYEYDPASATDQGGNITISADETSYVYVPGEDQEITLTITRVDDSEAQTVTLISDNEKFDVPATVSFAAGEKSKTITFLSSLSAGESEKVNITLAEEDAFIYGKNSVTISVSVYRAFKVTIAEDYWFEDSWDAVVYELGDGNYVIPNAFDNGFDWKFSIDFSTGAVKIPSQYIADYTGYDYGYMAYINSSASYDAETYMITSEGNVYFPDISWNHATTVYIVFEEDPQAE